MNSFSIELWNVLFEKIFNAHGLTLIILKIILKWFNYKSKKFSVLMEGTPVILIRNGVLNRKEMRNKITVEDMEQSGRENGIGDLSKIALAILEVEGKISILTNEHLKTQSKIEE